MEMQLRARPRSRPVTLETRAGYVAMKKPNAMILDINECVE